MILLQGFFRRCLFPGEVKARKTCTLWRKTLGNISNLYLKWVLEILFHLFVCLFSFHVFSSWWTLSFNPKGWGSWDCSALFPSFSLKSPFSVKIHWHALSCDLICRVIHAASIAKCLHIRLCKSFSLLLAYAYTAVWKIKHVEAYCYDLALEQWSCCFVSSIQSDGTLPAENLISSDFSSCFV